MPVFSGRLPDPPKNLPQDQLDWWNEFIRDIELYFEAQNQELMDLDTRIDRVSVLNP